jgi:PHS family inorganic phosphate transporter-like MFS transporter
MQQIFAINLTTSMMGIAFWQNSKAKGTIPPNSDTAIKVATSGGTVIGQLGFGYLADVVGRKRMYGLELILIIVATLAQALSSPSHAISFTGLIIFWRVLMVCALCFSLRTSNLRALGYWNWR